MAFVDTFAVASDTYLENHNEAGAWTRQGGVANAARIEADNDSVYFESTTRTAYLCPDQGSADHWSAAKLALIATSQSASHQIAVRVTDQDNYVGAGNTTSSTRTMRSRIAGTLSTLVSFSATAHEWLKVEAEGDTFRLFSGGTGAEPTWTQQGVDQTVSGMTGTRQGLVLQQSSTAVALTEYRADAIGGGGSPVTVAPATGHISVTGYAPTIAQPITLSPSTGHALASGNAPTIAQPRTIAPAKGSVQARGYAPVVQQGDAQAIAPQTGHIQFSGYAPAIHQPRTVAPQAGHISARGYVPEISQAASIRPETGHIVARGYAPSIGQPRAVAPQTGHALANGHAPIIVQGLPIVITPQAGHVSARGYAPGVAQGGAVTVSPETGHVVWRGWAPGITTMQTGGYPSSVTITVPAGRLMSAAGGRTITLRPR